MAVSGLCGGGCRTVDHAASRGGRIFLETSGFPDRISLFIVGAYRFDLIGRE